MKKLDSKFQKQQQSWPKISKTARKYNKDENMDNRRDWIGNYRSGVAY